MRRAAARTSHRPLLDPRRGLVALGGALLVFLAPMMARAQGASPDSVTLQWSAPGDDGLLGLATLYHMKFSTSPINSGNWALANEVPGMPAPIAAGSKQTVLVRGLSRDTTYYFAIRAEDDAGNLALISNVVTWDWVYDTAPPAAPTGVTAVKASGSRLPTFKEPSTRSPTTSGTQQSERTPSSRMASVTSGNRVRSSSSPNTCVRRDEKARPEGEPSIESRLPT